MRVMGNVRAFLWAGGLMACSCWRVPVRHGLLSRLRPESGSAWGCCSEGKGIMVYELIGKKKRQINNEVDWILTALLLCSSLRGLERWYWDSLLNKSVQLLTFTAAEQFSSGITISLICREINKNVCSKIQKRMHCLKEARALYVTRIWPWSLWYRTNVAAGKLTASPASVTVSKRHVGKPSKALVWLEIASHFRIALYFSFFHFRLWLIFQSVTLY